MSNNIIPRYSNNQVEEYTTTNTIRQHQPEIIQPSIPKPKEKLSLGLDYLAIESSEQLKALTQGGEQFPTIEERTPDRSIYSPNLRLTGHSDSVYALSFSNDGSFLLSGGKDKKILLWDVYNNCANVGVNEEAKNAILQATFSGDSEKIFAASADDCLHAIDIGCMVRFKRFKGHSDIVTSVDSSKTGIDLVLTGSNDATARVWDLRFKKATMTLQDKFPILSVVFSKQNYTQCFSAGIDNLIKKWDLRNPEKPLLTLRGHTDSITSIQLSSDGTQMLSNSMDNTVRCWNVKPFCLSENRCMKVYSGHSHGYDQNLLRATWNHNQKYVASGSSDNVLYVWNSSNRQVKMKLGGHEAVINDVKFSPVANLIASASNDKSVILTQLSKGL
jgi:Prp8 binding protein